MKERNTILIVDDLEMNRAILSNIFKKKYNIVEASNGIEALEYLRENSDKVVSILLDLVMPNMNGIDVLKTMRAERIAKEVPIFIITADNSEEVMYEAYELGVKDVLEKPFIPYFLKKRIESVIELYKIKTYQEVLLEEKVKNLKIFNQNIIELLALAIEFRNDDLGEHVKNIKNLTFKLLNKLRELGEEHCKELTDEKIKLISEATVLHDIGKIGITDEILNKNDTELDSSEKKIIESHPLKGAKILNKLIGQNEIFEYAYDICYNHHERWNGEGYPNKRKGNEISIWAQIVGMLDIYDKLINNRGLKKVNSKKEAIEVLKNSEYGSFNPILISALEEIEI